MARDPYRYFRVEAKEIVERLSRGVLELDQGKTEKEAVAQLLRLAHTLKGAAHVVKQAEIARLAHQIEENLLPFGDGKLPVSVSCVRDLLHQIDSIATQLAQLGPEQTSPAARTEPGTPPAEEAFDSLRVEIGEMDALLESVSEMSVQLAGLKAKLTALEEAESLAALLSGYFSKQAAGPTARTAMPASKARVLADDLQAMTRATYDGLSAGVEQLQRELTEVRDVASQLRLVPASVLFLPLQRAIRHAAEALNKQVEFETSGGEHRLDAHVLAAVRDLLLHVVRNAVAHGIEPPTARAAAGKATAGKIVLRVERRGNRVAFACRDDGRGFDVAALRRAAVARGLISAEEAEKFSSDEIIRVIFRGGVTTTGNADEVSGRGIGLDVVRQTAAALKADLNVHTESGRGTAIELCVPVSLLSLDAIRVASGGVQASVPMDAVHQTVRVQPGDVARTASGEALLFEGKTIPYITLERTLSREAGRPRSGTGRASALVIASGGELAALGVDRLVGAGAVVLRPIPAFAGVDPVVAGAFLDAEGNPQLVLDPAAIVAAAHAQTDVPGSFAEPPKPVVLVIDDSVTSRMLQQSILESAGMEVDLAASGEEALQKCRERNYSLFLVDVEMPGMDGFEFIERTQRDSGLRGVPAILVSSRSSAADRKRGREAGARAYMVKSEFDQANLLRMIRQLVN
jgi:two-component system chemotaxis sensor kinase CheA